MQRSVGAWVVGAVILAVLALVGGCATHRPISIMPLGDSITAGTVPGGYRRPMVQKLNSNYRLSVSTVGTQTDDSMQPTQQAHEGHGGWRIDQLCDNLLGVNAVDPSAHGGYWLDGGHGTGRRPVHPTCITVMAGINDINQFIGNDKSSPMSGRSDVILATIQKRLGRLVDTLTTQRPDATILLCGCIPYNNGLIDEDLTGANAQNRAAWAQQDGVSESQEAGVNHWVILFNKWIRESYVPQLRKAGKKVFYVDVYDDFILPDGSVRGWNNQEPQNTAGPAGYGDYGLHPNAFGYKLIGDRLAEAIRHRVVAPARAK